MRELTHTKSDHLSWLYRVLLLAALLRLGFLWIVAPAYAGTGGDTDFYLFHGLKLITNTLDYPVQPAPVFLLYTGLAQLIAPPAVTLSYLSLLNVGWHLVLIAVLYWIGLHSFGMRAARLAALVMAVNPIFIIEVGAVLTESLFLAVLYAALAWYAISADSAEKMTWGNVAVVGVLLGVATLTRAVLLLFPAAIIVHLLWQHGWRRGGKFAAVLIVVYGLTLSTWTVYNLWRWNRFIIAGEGLTAFTFMGATGTTDAHAIDAQLGGAAELNQRDGAFIERTLAQISNLPAYLSRRAANLGEAVLQPHNTIFYPGESLRTLLIGWASTDRSLSGLVRVTQGDAFWSKLVLYGFHWLTLGAGGLGLLWARRRFWALLPLYGVVGYFLLVHSVLFANPRYLLPIQPALMLFGAAAVTAISARRRIAATEAAIPQTA